MQRIFSLGKYLCVITISLGTLRSLYNSWTCVFTLSGFNLYSVKTSSMWLSNTTAARTSKGFKAHKMKPVTTRREKLEISMQSLRKFNSIRSKFIHHEYYNINTIIHVNLKQYMYLWLDDQIRAESSHKHLATRNNDENTREFVGRKGMDTHMYV